ncbi:MAG TPA: DUF3168 domain-containing protein [Longimicrobiales bacterium]
MNAGAVIFSRLVNQTAAGSRIFPLVLPQDATFPAVTYQQISSVRTHAMGQDGAIIRVRVQINSWGRSYAEARTLAGEVETQLSRFKGTVGGTRVLDVLLDNEIETYESETQARRVIQDFTFLLLSP